MAESNINDTGRDIWSLMSLDDLVSAITSLGHRIDQLKDDSWRLNRKTKSSSSCWSEVINRLKLDDNEKIHHTLCKIWHEHRHRIHDLVQKKKKEINSNEMKEGDSDDRNETENGSVAKKIIATLPSEPSLLLHEPPNTRAYQKAAASGNSTGGVLKPMKEQNQSLLYTIMFKDGTDPNENVPLAHAILTDHTVPGIGYFLGNVIHSVNQVTTKKKLRPPSFIVIDFSAALMNTAPQ
ncbi:unnamed protein product [Rotaria sordida]|uniref:Uncharacterized protein n=1 Tax=Rotaria sordida TaxID=392033 RepID=A0A815NRG4_9BILA|nr:unnamed protein product [Rotaria sordida]